MPDVRTAALTLTHHHAIELRALIAGVVLARTSWWRQMTGCSPVAAVGKARRR